MSLTATDKECSLEITDSFTVTAPPAQVWDLLLDVERVAPCMPGAELTDVIDDDTWAGRVKVKIGPVVMKYAGRVAMVQRDDDGRRVVMRAEGAEEGGKGGATALVRAQVDPTPDGGSHVSITQDLTLSGAAAQFGGRMIADVSAHLTKQFAANLNAELSGDASGASRTEAVPALWLASWAVLRAIGRLLRLPGRRHDEQRDR